MSCDPVDFVPAACQALHIANCLVNRDCQLENLDWPKIQIDSAFDLALNDLVDIQIRINELNACIIAGLVQAFLLAGCPFPNLDDPPDPPDFTACREELDRVADEIQNNPLGVATGLVNITFDANGVPIRIQG